MSGNAAGAGGVPALLHPGHVPALAHLGHDAQKTERGAVDAIGHVVLRERLVGAQALTDGHDQAAACAISTLADTTSTSETLRICTGTLTWSVLSAAGISDSSSCMQ